MPDLRKALAVFGIVLSGVCLQQSALAQEFCSEPVAPYCVDTDSEFDTELQINRCEADLNDYEEQLAEYEQCIAQQLDTMRQELESARDKLEGARANF